MSCTAACWCWGTAIPAEVRNRMSAITVDGTVRGFDRAALDNELGIDLSGQMWDAWRDRPVIVATPMAPGRRRSADGRHTPQR